MAGVEALARLNPKNVRFDVGSGGIPELTPEMVAAACAGLPDLAYRLALVKYAGQRDQVQHLAIRTLMEAAGMAVRGGWGKPRPGQLTGISRYAIWKVVGYQHCEVCSGSGKRLDDRRRSWNCPGCGGTGLARMDDAIESEVAGFSEEDWRNVWRRRAEQLEGVLDSLDGRVKAHIRRQLSNTE